jgi:hypothetical protein
VRWLRRFLVTFLLMSVSFGALFGFAMRAQGVHLSWRALAFAAVGYGAAMSLVFTGSSWFVARKRGSDAAVRVRQVRRVTVPAGRRESLDLCETSLTRVRKTRVLARDDRAGVLTARKGFTWKSFGDDIRFTIVGGDEREQHVEIESRPRIRTTLVDYGSNYDNVTEIVRFLTEHGATEDEFPASEF